MDNEGALNKTHQTLNPISHPRGKTYTQNALRANQLHQLILHGANSVAFSISLEVAQVTGVALRIGGSTVGLGKGVDWLGSVYMQAIAEYHIQ